MRMGIALAGHAVRGPTRMGDANPADDRHLRQRLLERPYFADGAQALQMAAAVEHGHAGRVIAAVLEPLQSLDQDWDDVPIRDPADYAAHETSVPLTFRSGLRRVLTRPLPLFEGYLARPGQCQLLRRSVFGDGGAGAD